MIKTIILLLKGTFCLALMILTIGVSGQISKDSISMIKHKGSFKYYQHNKEIQFMDLPSRLLSNPQAYKHIKKAKTYRTASNILLGVGIISLGFVILNYAAESVEEREASKVSTSFITGLFLSAGFIAISIPSRHSYKSNTRKAINLYNNGLNETCHNNLKLGFGLSGNGIGFYMQF